MRITIEHAINSADTDRFYDLYRAAFEPLRTRAAARHLLTPAEFAEDMTDERINKIIAWNSTGMAVGLTTVTTDLSAIPWIDPRFYINRYPEQAARHALFYLGYVLVAPDGDTYGVFKALIEATFQRCVESRGVIALDACAYNSRHAIGRAITKIPEVYGAPVTMVDTQTYYVADFGESHPGFF